MALDLLPGQLSDQWQRRGASVPPIRYPEGLPVSEHRDEIRAAIRDHQVVIVAGETGSGKTTQIPKICLELGRGVRGLIGHTPPRRIAARTVAERLAEELAVPLGDAVGYTVRFTDRVGDDTLVKVMTDGILLAEIQRDRLLSRYDTLIIDEAHERSLNIDFILGYVKALLAQRPDLKVVVTSATIDTERFSRHFDGAPIVEVSGRTYPVEIRYQPIDDDEEDSGRDQTQAICDAVEELAGEGPGDVLVFLSGEREIRDTADALARSTVNQPRAAATRATVTREGGGDIEVLPLYARLSAAEQHRVFQPHPGPAPPRRRVVLATNVAETSLTVPGIRYVVDAGTARISRYNRRTKVQRLPIEAISQASANQRAGRCGRVAPGICIRLYSEEDFSSRPEFTDPEILRTNLASVILQMSAIGLGDIPAFPFVDAPDARNINDGIDLLTELGAFAPTKNRTKRPTEKPTRKTDERDRAPARLTPIGRQLAQMPIDPRLARMVVEADRQSCVREVTIIAAALSIQDPRERPAEKAQEAAEHHGRFTDQESDFFSHLNLWNYLNEQQRELSSSQFRKMCKSEFLNYLRVREWQDLHGQLRQVLRSLGIRANREPADRNRIHRSLLAGLLSQIGLRDGESREYQGARNARFSIAAGSGLAKKAPRWVMAGELVETNRMWARTAARIQPEWAEALGAHLVVRSYGEPRWDAARGSVTANERVTLYGVPIVTRRRVDYGAIDREASRDIFIGHALVVGDWQTSQQFFRDNRKRLEELEELRDRARRRDLLVDDATLFDFYDRRVGSEVVSARAFDRWWRKARATEPALLDFTPEALLPAGSPPVDAERFPDRWHHGVADLDVTYEFEPGAEADGVTVHVPLAVLGRVSPDGFDWQVPGLRQELVTALIRTLPKAVRTSFVPAPDHARAFLARYGPDDGPLVETLERALTTMTGDPIPPGSWHPAAIPDHLKMTFRVEDAKGRNLAASKDLDALKTVLRGPTRAALAGVANDIERTGLRTWSFGTLPPTVEAVRAGQTVVGYPSLVDAGDGVDIRVLESESEQRRAMRAGTRRLLGLNVAAPTKAMQRRLTNQTHLALARSPYRSVAELFADCTACAIDHLVDAHGGPVFDEEELSDLAVHVRAGLPAAAAEVVTGVARILVCMASVEARMERAAASPALEPALADIRSQLDGLVYPGFATAAGYRRLPDVARYVEAVDRRLEKLPTAPGRDAALMARIERLERDHDRLRQRPGLLRDDGLLRDTELLRDTGIDEVGWMIEDLRVSFFAQMLGTPRPISEERVVKAMERLAR